MFAELDARKTWWVDGYLVAEFFPAEVAEMTPAAAAAVLNCFRPLRDRLRVR
ncbi:MAG: hypothetical protein HY909_09605 [Deltaproteobacteria bacterium]|nr:hypothetical protein [Deltaproteobacteria bacterium]